MGLFGEETGPPAPEIGECRMCGRPIRAAESLRTRLGAECRRRARRAIPAPVYHRAACAPPASPELPLDLDVSGE